MAGAGAGFGGAAAGGLTGAIGAKAAATAATAALLTAGAVEVKTHLLHDSRVVAGQHGKRRRCRVTKPAEHVAANGARAQLDAQTETVTVIAAAAPDARREPRPPSPPTTPVDENVAPVTAELPAATAPTDPADAALADDGSPPHETYTPTTAVVGPAAGGTGGRRTRASSLS